MDLNSYTVLHPFNFPHEDEEHFGPCPDCDNENPTLRGMVAAGDGLYKLCPTCGGTRGGGPSLGVFGSGHAPVTYLPGQTVKMTAARAKPYVDNGTLAPAGAKDADELLILAAVERLGYKVVKE